MIYHMTTYGHDITPWNKIDKPLVFTHILTLFNDVHCNIVYIRQDLAFSCQKHDFKEVLVSYDKKNQTFVLLYY